MTNELYHFGIKGMHWGVRRYQNPDGSLTPKGQKRYGKRETKQQEGPTRSPKGLSYKEIDKDMVKSINSKYKGTSNCLNCSCAYAYNRNHNTQFTATNNTTSTHGRSTDDIFKLFDNVKYHDLTPPNATFIMELPSASQAEKIIKQNKNTNGILHIRSMFGAHVFNYECDANGKVTYIDCQTNKIYKNSPYKSSQYVRVQSIFDMTDSVPKNNTSLMNEMFEKRK